MLYVVVGAMAFLVYLVARFWGELGDRLDDWIAMLSFNTGEIEGRVLVQVGAVCGIVFGLVGYLCQNQLGVISELLWALCVATITGIALLSGSWITQGRARKRELSCDMLIGQTGRILTASTDGQPARVFVGKGDLVGVWKARTDDGSSLDAGTPVRVLALARGTLRVERLGGETRDVYDDTSSEHKAPRKKRGLFGLGR